VKARRRDDLALFGSLRLSSMLS